MRFREITKPSLIKTVEGADQLTSGMVWVGWATVTVVRTVLELGGDLAADYVQGPIDGGFGPDPRLGFQVPVSMVEVYSRAGMRITASASYRNFPPVSNDCANRTELIQAGDSSSPWFESDVRKSLKVEDLQ